MMIAIHRRRLLAGLVATPVALALPMTARAGEAATVHVAKTATCGCCKIWVDYMRKQGFVVEATNMAPGELSQFKTRHGISPDLASCHTARVAGYTIEGHVPAGEIKRLLAEKPDAIGLTVPGMPLGSPGMDYGPEKEPYDVLLIARDGTTSIYASYKGPAG